MYPSFIMSSHFNPVNLLAEKFSMKETSEHFCLITLFEGAKSFANDEVVPENTVSWMTFVFPSKDCDREGGDFKSATVFVSGNFDS